MGSDLHRSPDKGEGKPEARGGGQDGPRAGRGHQRPLQHHLLRHAGRDPALPPDPRARLQGADAALPAAADHLLQKSHRQAGGGPAEVRRRLGDGASGPAGSDFGEAAAAAAEERRRASAERRGRLWRFTLLC